MVYSELTRLEQQLELTFEGDAWHGPSVIAALDGITAEHASHHPIPGAHSIWELVLHIASDYTLVLRRLGGDGRPLTPEEDWPACPEATAANWQRTLEELRRVHEELRHAVGTYPLERLDEPIVAGVPYPAYMQFIGVTQHNAYHAGQIMLLKRALG